MSSLTEPQIGILVRRRLGLPEEAVLRVIPLIPTGLEKLAHNLKETEHRYLLISEVNSVPAAGAIDLHGASFNSYLTDTFRLPGSIKKQTDDGTIFIHARSPEALKAQTPVDPNVVWYHLRGDSILTFKNPANGTLGTYTTPLTLAGVKIPTLSNLRTELEDLLLDCLVELMTEKPEALNADHALQGVVNG